MRARGGTALGPALLIATTMAAKIPGSKVIMCTDGEANLGIGSLGHNNDWENVMEKGTFYEEVATDAASKG